jgi:hypothetical protein
MDIERADCPAAKRAAVRTAEDIALQISQLRAANRAKLAVLSVRTLHTLS